MHYILDGYNVIGASKSIDLSMPDKENALIQELASFAQHAKRKLTVVFDGKSPDFKWKSQYRSQGINVVLTDADETADAYIIRHLKKKEHKQSLIVVSSDNEILLAAKHAHVKAIRSSTFWEHVSDTMSECSPNTPKTMSEHDVNAWLDIFGNK
jgi:predicted RNA-binding protein with PIN domain